MMILFYLYRLISPYIGEGKAKVGEGTPSSQREVQHQQISRGKNRKNKAITTSKLPFPVSISDKT